MKKSLIIPAFLMALGVARAQEGDSAKTAAPAAPTADAGEELTKVKGQVDGLNESYLETKTTVDKLAKLKIGGYIQAQWQHADSNGIGSVAGGNFPGTSDQRLQIRRGRLKASYDAGTSQYIAELELLPSGVSLKDAEIVLIEPWLKTFSLAGGLMDRPFGYEIGYSSSAHETPERSRLAQTVFPGEKDLGVKLEINPNESMGALSWFSLKAGAYTGTAGASAPGNVVALSPTKVTTVKDSTGKATKDTVTMNLPTGKAVPAANGDEIDSSMDFIGRLGFKLPFNDINLAIDGGVSAYYGRSLSGNDTVYQMSGTILGITTGNKNKNLVREAYGADLQLYYDLPVIGGMCLRGEYVQGTMPGTVGSNKPYGTSAAAVGPDYPNAYMAVRSFNGWYATWVQNFGTKLQSVVRYDVFDPNTDAEGKDVAAPTAGNRLGAQDLAYNTLGLGLVYYWDSNFKFTAFYDMVTNEEASSAVPDNNAFAVWKKDLNDNVFTLRAQMKF